MTDDIKEKLLSEFSKLSDSQMSAMQNSTDAVLSSFSGALKEEADKGLKTLSTIASTIETEAMHEVENFRTALEKKTTDSKGQIDALVAAELAESKNRISAYEKEKIQEMDSNMSKIMSIVSKDILGKNIDIQTSEDMVIAALERAKAEGVFNES